MLRRMIALLGLTAMAAPAAAGTTHAFSVRLTGTAAPTATGSAATGRARIRLDDTHQTVSIRLDVKGITIDQLADRLVKAPIGPIHFHIYPSRDRSPDAPVALVLPMPFGADYVPRGDGFRVTVTDYAFADGAKLVGSQSSFAQFETALQSGTVILNIHTDRFPDGEISGTIAAHG